MRVSLLALCALLSCGRPTVLRPVEHDQELEPQSQTEVPEPASESAPPVEVTPEPQPPDAAPAPLPELPLGVFVDAACVDTCGEGTADSPFLALQEGVAQAEAQGLGVYVAAGAYMGSLLSAASIHGGYGGQARAWLYDPDQFVTELVPTLHYGIVLTRHDDTHPDNVVVFEDITVRGADGNALQGLTRGVHVHPQVHAVIRRNVIDGGTTNYGYASGVDCFAAGVVYIEDNEIRGGYGPRSYGVKAWDGTTFVRRNRIAGGSGRQSSHGVYVEHEASLELHGNFVHAGTSAVSRFAMKTEATVEVVASNNVLDVGEPWLITSYGAYVATATLVHNTILGGHVAIFSAGPTIVANNILAPNWEDGTMVQGVEGATVTLVHNGFWASLGFCVLSCEVAGCVAGETWAESGGVACGTEISGNLVADPLFSDDGFHLRADSPYIDAAVSSSPWLSGESSLDIDGSERPFELPWDIGADEY